MKPSANARSYIILGCATLFILVAAYLLSRPGAFKETAIGAPCDPHDGAIHETPDHQLVQCQSVNVWVPAPKKR